MAGLKIGYRVLGMCQTNCYFLYREGDNRAIVVDPADAGDMIYTELRNRGLEVKGILLTHGHFDHVSGMNSLVQLTGAKCYACEHEKEVCRNPVKNLTKAFMGDGATVEPDIWVKDGDEITIADMKCRVIHTPGHTVGSCCYYFEDDKVLISGDTLFQHSVGRTDFPTGSMSQIVRSIKEKLFVLSDDVRVFPGHGDPTTIQEEKNENPFCQ